MSIRAWSLVWERSRAKGGNLLMLLSIADYAKDDGRWAWPSARTLTWKTRLSGRAGELILMKLVRDGEIWPEWNAAEERLYLHVRCVFDWEAYETEGINREREKISRNQSESFSRKLMTIAADRLATAKSTTPKAKKPTVPSSSSDPLDPSIDPSVRESFARVWAAYPRQEGERPAFAVWLLLQPSAALEDEILAAIARQRHLPQWQDPRYVPLLRRYLEDGRWTDRVPDPSEAPLSPKELDHARLVRNRTFGCRHDPRHDAVEACVRAIAYGIREKAQAAV